jgi:hypothetical protein
VAQRTDVVEAAATADSGTDAVDALDTVEAPVIVGCLRAAAV